MDNLKGKPHIHVTKLAPVDGSWFYFTTPPASLEEREVLVR